MQKNNSLILSIILSTLNVVISYISTGYVAVALEVLLSLYVLYLIAETNEANVISKIILLILSFILIYLNLYGFIFIIHIISSLLILFRLKIFNNKLINTIISIFTTIILISILLIFTGLNIFGLFINNEKFYIKEYSCKNGIRIVEGVSYNTGSAGTNIYSLKQYIYLIDLNEMLEVKILMSNDAFDNYHDLLEQTHKYKSCEIYQNRI